MNKLFPPINQYKTEYLKVSEIHTLYLEQSGNPNGLPIVSLHGGPGSYSKPDHRRFFDPKKYRIIIFDQRGSGKSKPLGELKENTTWDLVEDMEKIRKHLLIKKWIVSGGSWGSTLALTYAEKYPDYVKTLILTGIFTFRKEEIDWLSGGVKFFFPDAWEDFITTINGQGKKDINHYLIKLSQEKDRQKFTKTAQASEIFNSYLMKLIPKTYHNQRLSPIDLNEFRIFFHYAKNNGFFYEGQLIKEAYKIKNVPTVIIQGRYDMCCPPITAWELKKQLPKAEMVFVPAAGHKSDEPGITDQIIKYTNRFSSL